MVAVGTRVRAADGCELHAEVEGSGPTLLLVQGLGYATWGWARQRAALARHFRVVMFDNRGAGRSDKPDEPYSIELFAEDARSVLEELGSPPANVLGLSMGGYVAQTLAASHRDLVSALVLVSTSCGGEGAVDVPDETKAAWARASGLEPREFARATMPLSFAPGWTDAHPDEFEELLAARLAYPTPAYAWRRQYDAAAAFLARGIDAAAIDQPTLVVHGTADRVVPYANAELLVERLPNARLLRLEGAGHLALIERADEVNAAIAEFLS